MCVSVFFFRMKNHVWQATIAVFSLYTCGVPGTIQSDLVYSTIDTNTSSIMFNNLELDATGGYILLASIRSTNNEYNLNCRSNSIIVKNSSMNFEINDDIDPNIVLIFKADYQANLHNIEMFKSMFYNCIYNKYKLVKTRSIMVYNGSIGINSGATGSVDQISSLAAEIKNGSFNFNGFTLESAIIFDQLAKAADVVNPGTGGGGIGGGSSTESDSAKQSAVNSSFIIIYQQKKSYKLIKNFYFIKEQYWTNCWPHGWFSSFNNHTDCWSDRLQSLQKQKYRSNFNF